MSAVVGNGLGQRPGPIDLHLEDIRVPGAVNGEPVNVDTAQTAEIRGRGNGVIALIVLQEVAVNTSDMNGREEPADGIALARGDVVQRRPVLVDFIVRVDGPGKRVVAEADIRGDCTRE